MKAIISGLAFLILASTATAQERPVPEQRGLGRGGDLRRRAEDNQKWFQLLLEPVQSDLALSKEVIDSIRNLFDEQKGVVRELRDGMGSTPELLEKIREDYIAKIKELLTDAQRARLEQIHLQNLGVAALLRDDVRDKLQLSTDQLKKFQPGSRGGWGVGDSRSGSREAELAKVMNVLDAQQKELFKNMLGKKFNRTRTSKREITGDDFHPRSFQVTVEELRQAIGLDIYKFNVFMQKQEKFNVVLREFADKDSSPTEILNETFTPRSDADIDILVCFRKLSGASGSALLSKDEQLECEIICRSCEPFSSKQIVATPLSTAPSRVLVSRDAQLPRPETAKGTVLLRLKPKGSDVGFPYAELVIEKASD